MGFIDIRIKPREGLFVFTLLGFGIAKDKDFTFLVLFGFAYMLKKNNQKMTKYFKISEFDSPDVPGSGQRMQLPFLSRLTDAREIAGVPFRINSGYRTPEHNKKVGGTPGSSHLTGWAADIAVKNNRERQVILSALIQAGFTRIGIGKTFLHVDSDPAKNPAVWLY